MISFFKANIVYLTENSVNPDRRRYAVEGEAPRHYIDIDVYGKEAIKTMPRRWNDAVAKYSEDTLMAYGIVPWHIVSMKYRLTKAFEEQNVERILLLAADLGHYIGDANVPLHTTVNYNGQLTGQYGIHGFWESRLPELFSDNYDLFFEDAHYEKDVTSRAWLAVENAHAALDSVLKFERELTLKMGEDRKFGYEMRGNVQTRVYSREFSEAYHTWLNGQVERQMRAAIKMVGDLWYTAWVDAGSPDLNKFVKLSEKEIQRIIEEQEKELKERKVNSRDHEGYLHDCACPHLQKFAPKQRPLYTQRRRKNAKHCATPFWYAHCQETLAKHWQSDKNESQYKNTTALNKNEKTKLHP